jgi:hypothetical protein
MKSYVEWLLCQVIEKTRAVMSDKKKHFFLRICAKCLAEEKFYEKFC